MEERPVVEERLVELAKAIQYLPNYSASVKPGGIEIRYIWEHDGRHLSTTSMTPWKGIRQARVNLLLLALKYLEEQADKWGEDDDEDSKDQAAT